MSRFNRSDLVEITVAIERETALAILVHEGDKTKAAWLPRSAIEIEPTRNKGIVVITLPESLSQEKGLI